MGLAASACLCFIIAITFDFCVFSVMHKSSCIKNYILTRSEGWLTVGVL